MNGDRLPPPPWSEQKYPNLPQVPKFAPVDSWVAFENAAAETTARIRSGLSLPSSPDAKGGNSRARRRYGSEPPPSPGMRWPGFSPRARLWRLPPVIQPVGELSSRLAGLELPQPPLPPVAGELRLRLEALEQLHRESREQKTSSLSLELEKIRSAYLVIQAELEQKSEQQSLLEREVADLRLEIDRVGQDKEALQQALELLEESKSQALQERSQLEEECRRLSEALKASERKERQLERSKSQSKELLEQKERQLKQLQADGRSLKAAVSERERAEQAAREAQNHQTKMLAQKQREIDQLTEENRLLRVELENFEEERSRVVVLERSTRQSQEELRQSQEELRHSEEHRQVLRRNVEELKRQHAAQLEKQRLLERDFAHLKAALKQREQAGRSLQTALTEQKRLVRVATAEEARFQAASDDASELYEPLGPVGSLPSLPRAPVSFGAGFVEADMTSRRTSKASSLLEVDMTGDT